MMQFLQALAGTSAAPGITGKSAFLTKPTIKNMSVNNSALNYLRTCSKLSFSGIGHLYEPESSPVPLAYTKPDFETRPDRVHSSKGFPPILLFLQERLSNVQ